MKNRIAALIISVSLAFGCAPAVYAQENTSENISTESETEVKEPVKSGTYKIELESDEPEEEDNKEAADEEENVLTFFFSDNVNNDVTGKWRISKVATTRKATDYALEYYKTLFSSDDEIHGIVNFTDSTTIRITSVFSDTIDVSVLSYVDGEEHDAKLLFGGDLLEDYWINVETGEIEDIMNEEE